MTVICWINDQEGDINTEMLRTRYGAVIHVVRFDQEWIGDVPIAGVDFDCFVVIFQPDLRGNQIAALAVTLARANSKWIEVFGPGAEMLHDAIDNAAVAAQRQTFVGEGNPMTSWHEVMPSEQELADYICAGGQGFCARKMLVIVGDEIDMTRIVSTIESLLY